MLKTNFKLYVSLGLLMVGLVCLFGTKVMGQIPEEPDPPQAQVIATPGFVTELVEQTELTADQVEQMRSGGAGWGNIMIATRLAEWIVANSPNDDKLTFEQVLAIVLEERAKGKGFGQIANENDMKVGAIVEGEDSPNGSSRPRFIAELVEKTDLTQDQVDQMRDDGAGWGNIMISTRLAERIAADSPEGDDKLTFEQTLDLVLEARANDMGFGEIAHQHDLKVGKLVAGGKKVMSSDPETPVPEGTLVRSRIRAGQEGRPKKQSMFGRLFGMFRSGRTARVNKPLKPERPERPNRPEKFERPERPTKPEKPEKPERPPKPEKPEKPERGPRR